LFGETFDSSNLNSTNSEGENALHVAIHQDNDEMAKLLIEAGINVNQAGEQAHTPLHDACFRGKTEIVQLLLEKGADVFALDEGVPPLTMARYGGHDSLCDLLGIEMEKRQTEHPDVWIRARIGQLKREIENLEQRLSSGKSMGGAA
jgi:hypothetical protein